MTFINSPSRGRFPTLALIASAGGTGFDADFAEPSGGQSTLITTIDVTASGGAGGSAAYIAMAIDTFPFFSEEHLLSTTYGRTTWQWRGELLIPQGRALTIVGNCVLSVEWGATATGWIFPQ